MSDDSAYEKVAEMWRLPGSKKLMRIMKNGFTPEEAEVMVGLSAYITPEDLAIKLNMPLATVQERLNGLSRGWARSRQGKYITVPNMIAIIPHVALPGVPEEERRAQWLDWFRTEEYSTWQLESWVRMTRVTGHPIHRILPSHRALMASPRVDKEQILWYEDMPQVFERVKKIFVGPCGCRSVWGVCDSPMQTCMGVSYDEPPPPPPAPPGAPADRRPRRKEITTAEAMAIIEDAEDRAMLNIPPNNAVAAMFCMCCPCCCEIVYPYRNHGDSITNYANLSPSRYRAVIDREACTGCQTCIERCHFDAIEMQKAPDSKKLKAAMINEKCMGCGLCVLKCPQNAITLELVRPPEHIPTMKLDEGEARRLQHPNWLTAPVK